MIESTLVPFLFGTLLLIILGLMALYDPFRVGAHTALLMLSVFLASVLSWGLWIAGNAFVISWFPVNLLAWDSSLIVAMIIGPVVIRWFMVTVALSDDSRLSRDIAIALAGATAGAFIGRFALSEMFATDYSGIGTVGSARPLWVFTGAVIGGHLHAAATAVQGILQRREP
jgi:hypothetical protein